MTNTYPRGIPVPNRCSTHQLKKTWSTTNIGAILEGSAFCDECGILIPNGNLRTAPLRCGNPAVKDITGILCHACTPSFLGDYDWGPMPSYIHKATHPNLTRGMLNRMQSAIDRWSFYTPDLVLIFSTGWHHRSRCTPACGYDLNQAAEARVAEQRVEAETRRKKVLDERFAWDAPLLYESWESRERTKAKRGHGFLLLGRSAEEWAKIYVNPRKSIDGYEYRKARRKLLQFGYDPDSVRRRWEAIEAYHGEGDHDYPLFMTIEYIPNTPGVYTLRLRNVAMYVGESVDLKNRLSEHRRGGSGSNFKTNYWSDWVRDNPDIPHTREEYAHWISANITVTWDTCETKAEAEALEHRIIADLDPLYNRKA